MSKAVVVSLHSRCGTGVAITYCAVDHVKASLPLIQSQLEVGSAAPWEILRPPFDVQDAVGRGASDRGKDPKPTVYRVQVVPIWEDRVVMSGPWQANVGKVSIRRRELGIAVRRQIHRVKGLIIKRKGEGQRKCGDAVVAMIADIRRARHDTAGSLNDIVARAGGWGWSCSRSWRGAGCRCRGWRRQRNIPSGLNPHKRRRAGLKVAYHRVRWIGRLIGIKPEVIQSAESNRVGILILSKSFRAPGDRACVLGNIPRRAAISSISLCAIMCKAGLLRRRMKADVRDVYSRSNRHAERLDGAIEVLVVQRIFIVPDPSSGVRHFIAHEPDTIGAWSRLNLVYCRTCPSHNRRMLSHGGSGTSKTKGLINSGYGVRAVRSVVIHVALIRMTLAPGAFVGDDVFRFGKISRPRVHRRVQVVNVNQHSVRGYVMNVAGVI